MKLLLCFYDDEDKEPTTKLPATVKVSNVMPSRSNFARNILRVSVKNVIATSATYMLIGKT